MADIFSIISWVCLGLAALCFIGSVALFFALNTKAAYLELQGQPQMTLSVSKKAKKRGKSSGGKATTEVPTSKMDVEDEAVTTLDNGEIATELSVMNVYEPGTELMDDNSECRTEVETIPLQQRNLQDEETTEILHANTDKKFIITKRKIFVHSDEILR